MHHFFRFSRSDTGTAHKKNAWTALQTNFFFTRRTENVGEAQRDTIVPGQTNFRTATFAWCVSREKTKRVWPVQAFLIWKPRKIKYQRCSTIVFESALFVFPFFTCKAKRTIKASVFFFATRFQVVECFMKEPESVRLLCCFAHWTHHFKIILQFISKWLCVAFLSFGIVWQLRIV